MKTQENDKKANSGVWRWYCVGVLVAVLALGALMYIGWFDNKTHVDTDHGGDDVLQTYEQTTTNADKPGTANWENADHRNLDQIITDPADTVMK